MMTPVSLSEYASVTYQKCGKGLDEGTDVMRVTTKYACWNELCYAKYSQVFKPIAGERCLSLQRNTQ